MDGLQVSTDSHKMALPRPVPNEQIPQPLSAGEEKVVWHEPRKTTRNPFGLKPIAFGLLISIITCILTAAIVGGAVGGALGSKNNLNHSSTTSSCIPTTTTTTASATTTTSSAEVLVNDYAPVSFQLVNTTAFPYCPDQDGQTIVSPKGGDTYKIECNINAFGNDIFNIIAYSLDECIQACTNMNDAGANGISCVAVNFWAELQASFANSQGNCWLKHNYTSNDYDTSVPHLAAVLQ